MSASSVAKLRDLVEATCALPASSYADVTLDGAKRDLTVGDLRALLSQLDTMERALVVMQTPSDNERRQFIGQAAIAFAAAEIARDGAMLPKAARGAAEALWLELQKEDC